eukprot:NODE_389_length_9467_cov_0.241567.p1 type:complete len:496 gc:universal NODE_389_length_9467_cov_0.241567:7198-5711(-)
MSQICRLKCNVKNEPTTVIVTTQSLIIGTTIIPSINIKRQMQSKPHSKKIQLLIETIDAAHLDAKYKIELNALDDRELLKNALSRIINTHEDDEMLDAPPMNSNPEQIAQNELLRQHSLLRKLYSDLVPSKMSNEDFWSTRKHLIKAQMLVDSQEKGTDLNVLSQNTSESIGDGESKFTLTPSIIQSIFIQYPSIKTAYQETVPDRISEQEFWTRYFKSRLFHRIRDKKIHMSIDPSTVQPGSNKDDIFDKCLIHEMSNRINTINVDESHLDVYLNLEQTIQDKSDSGNRPDFTMRMKEQGLIRGLNRQSFGLLEHVKRTKREPVLINDLNEIVDQVPDTLNISNRQDYQYKEHHSDADVVMNDSINLESYFPSMNMLTVDFIENCESSSKEMQKELVKQCKTISLSDLPSNLQIILEDYKSQTLEYLRHFWTCIQLGNVDKARRMVVALGQSQNNLNAQLQIVNQVKLIRHITQHLSKAAELVITGWNSGEFKV